MSKEKHVKVLKRALEKILAKAETGTYAFNIASQALREFENLGLTIENEVYLG